MFSISKSHKVPSNPLKTKENNIQTTPDHEGTLVTSHLPSGGRMPEHCKALSLAPHSTHST